MQIDLRRKAPGCRVTEEDHLAVVGVELGMGGHRPFELSAEVEAATRCKRFGVDLEGGVGFFEGQQTLAVPDHIGIGQGRVQLHHPGIGIARIAEGARQSLALGMFEFPLGRADPAVAIGDAAVFDMKGMQHAVARKPVIGPAWRELGIGTIAIEPAIEFARHLAGDRQIGRIALHVQRRVIAAKEGIIDRERL